MTKAHEISYTGVYICYLDDRAGELAGNHIIINTEGHDFTQ